MPADVLAAPVATGRDWRPVPFRVVARRRETRETWTLELEGPGPVPFDPGQFTMLSAGGCGEVPISISGDPAHPERLVHTVRSVGLATAAICASVPGRALGVRGPFGRGWPLADAVGADLLLVAGGCGLAPLRPVVSSALAGRPAPRRITLLVGVRDPGLVLFRREIETWAAAGALDAWITVDATTPGWTGRCGRVTAHLADAVTDPASTLAFVVGPEPMMRAVLDVLGTLGVPSGRVHLALERTMQCGTGVCGHCQLGPLLVCRDGPVVRAADAARWLEVPEL